MTGTRTIRVAREGAAARLVLDRPEARNAMTPGMIAEIRGAFEGFSADDRLRAVVIEGAGPAFCAGGDLAWMRDVAGMTEAEVAEDSRSLLEMYEAVASCPRTVIARVHGAAYAGALGLLACSDVVVARRDARFCVSEVRVGLVPGIIAALIVPRSGSRWLRYLAASAVPFDGETARLAGLAHELADDDEALDRRVAAHVALALEASPDAVRKTAALIAALDDAPHEELLSIGLRCNAKSRSSEEAREGIAAFLGKRRPSWAPDR